MLTALDEGVKGGRWFSLIDKVHPERNLRAAFSRVAANEGAAGVDHVTVTMFEERLDAELKDLGDALRTGSYRPQAIRRCHIPKPGSGETRPLGIPTIRDRVVQTALRHVLEPIFERDFAAQSYGFRPGRGCKDALRRVDELLKAGYAHVVDADLKSYFDTIPHDALLALVARKTSDGKVLNLIDAFLRQGVMDGLAEWTPETGTPEGAVISPLLSNIYLDPLDRLMAEGGVEMVRYADDFVILCRTAEDAARVLDQVRQWTAQAGLTLHPTKTRVIDAGTESFDFLGRRFEGGRPSSSPQEPGQVEDDDPGQDVAQLRREPRHDHRHAQSDASRLVWNTSSTAVSGRSPRSTSGYGCGCEASSATASAWRDEDAEPITNAGPTPSSPTTGSTT
ncbi:Group II intron-encoded protein LtrA [Paludisphaera borealis]|uniref:Group II intron-encoded protein LtrA n=1 Tax=Paludisphaera borealis TaxID=1387353 RepID=A0A1U7CY11_9BACT|nr:group II intron reverse transcriptase/maturase [Paludisphaera borealis]APW63834.1 Group II intron-encoded protein LtrA [Paludisphaera borealis]